MYRYMSFRKNLEHLRKSAKLSQEDFAYKLGVSRQAVSKWESGAAYPETEKILKMCDIFNCSLDELMKDDIAQIRSEQSKKYSFSDMLEVFNKLLRGTFENFSSLSGRGKLKFLFEILILFLLILLVKRPFHSLDTLGANIFLGLGKNVGTFLANIWHLIVEVAYFIVAVGLFVYIYKVRFLDRFEEIVKKSSVDEVEKSDGVKENGNMVVEERKVIRYDFGILSSVGKVFLFFVKIFVILTLSPFLFLFFLCGVGLAFLFILLFNGIFYFGPILLAISVLVFIAMLLYVGFNFVLNRRNIWTRVFIVFAMSILGLSFGVGISSFEFSKMKFINEVHNDVEMTTEVVEFQMDEKLYFNLFGNTNSYTYEVDDSLKDIVKVKVVYPKDYNSFAFKDAPAIDRHYVNLYFWGRNSIDMGGFTNMLLDDLKNRTFRNYTKLGYADIVIISSKENIEKLRGANSLSGYIQDGVYYGE